MKSNVFKIILKIILGAAACLALGTGIAFLKFYFSADAIEERKWDNVKKYYVFKLDGIYQIMLPTGKHAVGKFPDSLSAVIFIPKLVEMNKKSWGR